MRLLNTRTHTLSEFQSNIPPYAILSHVWQTEEVTFQDIANPNKAILMKGWEKIVGACNVAERDSFQYIWIDTCCINKESSAELSEAINSMYAWYQNAHICYAHLWDVPSGGGHDSLHSPFSLSSWFTRGWTLQELIAPSRVIFCGSDWTDIGTKATLHKTISAITGIDARVIVGGLGLNDIPIAVRMSWAAKRNTSREEDVAYSLMGIFDINMPLLYGEGRKAFIRLQHEIISKSNDHSIFAWTTNPRPTRSKNSRVPVISDTYRGMLARSPRDFLYSHSVERISQVSLGDTELNDPTTNIPTPYSITNQGLHIKLPIAIASPHIKPQISAFLNCRFSRESDSICIILAWSDDLQRYVRSETIPWPAKKHTKPVHLAPLYIADDYHAGNHVKSTNLKIRANIPSDYGEPKAIFHENLIGFVHGQGVQFLTNNLGDADFIVFNEPWKQEHFAVLFGVWKTGAVWCDILTNVKPVGHSDQEIRDAYKTAATSKACSAVENGLLDRASADLAGGWSVTVSLTLDTQSQLRGNIELKRLSKQHQLPPVPLPVRLSGMNACLVVPLTRQHGFVMDVNNLQRKSPGVAWFQHFDALVLHTQHRFSARESLEVAVPFKSSTSEEKFYLLLTQAAGAEFRPSIQEEPSRRARYTADGRDYKVKIGQGKTCTVFVTQRKCDQRSLADWIVYVSM